MKTITKLTLCLLTYIGTMNSVNLYQDLPVLVTGGAGFIGSYLSEKLVELGAQVTVLDNLSSGNLDNLKKIKDRITFMHESIENFETCMRATKGKTVVFHLAAFISVPESVKNPNACFATNVTGTLNLLEACARNNVSRFALSSSAAIYGPTNQTCVENMPSNPQSPYGMSKWIAEKACQSYAYQVGAICLRYFNVYGERQNPDGEYAAVVAKFKHQMQQNKPITIFGDGMQTRDFIPVDQVVAANLQLAMLPSDQMNGQPFNIATGKSITLIELIDHLQKEYQEYNHPLLFQPARHGDIRHSSADCSKWQGIGTQNIVHE